MGIQGLLPIFKSISQSTHVSEYAGKKVAVDTYSWLHKGALSCSRDLCQGRPTNKYVDYCMHRVKLLQHSKVIPVLVFDGGPLPGKLEEEGRRAMSRKENLAKAVAHEKEGNLTAAYECYQKAVDITPAHALRLIKVLQAQNIEYIVAPYEADAQLAYLALNGLVDAVITEDSDLVAHGCPKVLFKMDKFGNGVQLLYSDLVKTKELCFTNFTQQMVLEMCIFSGCDYLSSLPGMGVKRAHALMKRFKNFRKAIKWLKFQGTDMPAGYEDAFHRAMLTFRHQRVFDPVSQRAVFLTDPHGSDVPEDLDFVGPPIAPDVARAIATAQICPVSRAPFKEPERQPAAKDASTGKRKAKVLEQNTIHRYMSVKISNSAKKPFKVPRTAAATDAATANETPPESDPEEPSARIAGDDFDDWNRIPSASLPDSEDFDLAPAVARRKQGSDFGRRANADDFDFELDRGTSPVAKLDLDSDLDLDNPFEAFRQKARKSPSKRSPGDLFGAEKAIDWTAITNTPDRTMRDADFASRTPHRQDSFRNFRGLDSRLVNSPGDVFRDEPPLKQRVNRSPGVNNRENTHARRSTEIDAGGYGTPGGEQEEGFGGFGGRDSRLAHTLQPVRLPDLNRGAPLRETGAKPARKTSGFFKKPAPAAARADAAVRTPGLSRGLDRTGVEREATSEEEDELRGGARETQSQERRAADGDNPARPRSRVNLAREQQSSRDDDDNNGANWEGSSGSHKLEHLKAYGSTAKKAMEGLVSKLRTFKYVPSSSRQSALRDPLRSKLRNNFPR